MAQWEPFHDLVEKKPGVWECWSFTGDTHGRQPISKHGEIRLVRNRGVAGYRCVFLPSGGVEPVVLPDLAPSLRAAARATTNAYRATIGPRGHEAAHYPKYA